MAITTTYDPNEDAHYVFQDGVEIGRIANSGWHFIPNDEGSNRGLEDIGPVTTWQDAVPEVAQPEGEAVEAPLVARLRRGAER